MNIDILALDLGAIQILDAALIEDDWFQHFNIPPNLQGLRRKQLGNSIYLLSDTATETSDLLIIRIGTSGVFANAPKPRTAFERIVRVALRQFDRSISLPVAWQVYHEGSRLSVFADSFSRKSKRRIYFEQAPNGTTNILGTIYLTEHVP